MLHGFRQDAGGRDGGQEPRFALVAVEILAGESAEHRDRENESAGREAIGQGPLHGGGCADLSGVDVVGVPAVGVFEPQRDGERIAG